MSLISALVGASSCLVCRELDSGRRGQVTRWMAASSGIVLGLRLATGDWINSKVDGCGAWSPVSTVRLLVGILALDTDCYSFWVVPKLVSVHW